MNTSIQQLSPEPSQVAAVSGGSRAQPLPDPRDMSTVDWTDTIALWASDILSDCKERTRDLLHRHSVLSALTSHATTNGTARVLSRK